MEKFKDVDTWDLIKELQSRGFITELLWCRDDVKRHYDNINEDREEHEKFPPMDDMDMDNILDSLSYEWHCERMNEEIYDKVWEYLNEGT
jgi:hypothetical protein